MKILHTSDLHIGKRLKERERLPEQIEALDEIVGICEAEGVSLVLIAGDVFDTYLPPAEAEEVFFRAVKKLAGESRAVVIVSGNHDDGVRLSASAPLAEEQGVYIFGGPAKTFGTHSTRPVRAVEVGENMLVIENEKGERVYINALPYPNEASLKEDKTEESYSEKMRRRILKGDEGYRGDMPHILLSHLFVAGGKTSDSERDIDLGGARAVPVSVFEKEGYVALGHLHRKQKIGNARYSGSILQYSFDETSEKSVVLLETCGNSFLEREIPLKSGKKLVRLECASFSEALDLLPRYRDCFIELTLLLKQPLSTEESRQLEEANEGLVFLLTRVEEGESAPILSRAGMSGQDLFRAYFRYRYDAEPEEELVRAFLTLTEGEE